MRERRTTQNHYIMETVGLFGRVYVPFLCPSYVDALTIEQIGRLGHLDRWPDFPHLRQRWLSKKN